MSSSTYPTCTDETWMLSRSMLWGMGAEKPSRSTDTVTVVPGVPRISSRASAVVQPSVLSPSTPTITSPTWIPTRSAGKPRKTAVTVMRSFSWVICTPMPA